MTDLTVKTPLGEGVLRVACFMGRKHEYQYLVRLPVNDVTRPHLSDPNCINKTAKVTALFSFTAAELGMEEQK